MYWGSPTGYMRATVTDRGATWRNATVTIGACASMWEPITPVTS
ncbi:Uncharacterised protein [Mycobacteroides abscessus subsp. abscessus]|nr:Uncharacterised protein [Mycobacteroides abscessus subsp. abscessus]